MLAVLFSAVGSFGAERLFTVGKARMSFPVVKFGVLNLFSVL